MKTWLAAAWEKYENFASVVLPILVCYLAYAGPLRPQPTPLPAPQPSPAPAPDPRPEPRPAPTPLPVPPSPNATVAAGHSYGVVGLCGTYASAWDTAASQAVAGVPMATVQSNLQSSWQTARTAEGVRTISPILEAIIPGGTEGDSASRKQWAAAAKDLATGLREVR